MSDAQYDLSELPGPAPYYVTPAMANSVLKGRGCAWPISGDHSTRANEIRANDSRDISVYIELARRR